jgi:hypothetical protein
MSTLSVLPPKTRVKTIAGDDLDAGFRFSVGGVPTNVTGTHLAQIRTAPTSPAVLGIWTVDATRAVEGILVLGLSASTSKSLPPNTSLSWDLEWVGPSNKTKTLLRGTLFLEADTTR